MKIFLNAYFSVNPDPDLYSDPDPDLTRAASPSDIAGGLIMNLRLATCFRRGVFFPCSRTVLGVV